MPEQLWLLFWTWIPRNVSRTWKSLNGMLLLRRLPKLSSSMGASMAMQWLLVAQRRQKMAVLPLPTLDRDRHTHYLKAASASLQESGESLGWVSFQDMSPDYAGKEDV